MKLRNLFIIGLSLVPLVSVSTALKAEMTITIGDTTVKTDSNQGVRILTQDEEIDTSDDLTIYDNDDDLTDLNNSSSRTTCMQRNSQSARINGSNRTVTQNNQSNKCD
jgi:hypothetical protein